MFLIHYAHLLIAHRIETGMSIEWLIDGVLLLQFRLLTSFMGGVLIKILIQIEMPFPGSYAFFIFSTTAKTVPGFNILTDLSASRNTNLSMRLAALLTRFILWSLLKWTIDLTYFTLGVNNGTSIWAFIAPKVFCTLWAELYDNHLQ